MKNGYWQLFNGMRQALDAELEELDQACFEYRKEVPESVRVRIKDAIHIINYGILVLKHALDDTE